jgi:mRNA interferase MazF
VSVPGARQGEVWDANLSPVVGHEQAGLRPCVVISIDSFGTGPSDLAIVVPVTTKTKTRLDVAIHPPEGGLDATSYALPYQLRTISRERLVRRRGTVSIAALTDIVRRARVLIRVD